MAPHLIIAATEGEVGPLRQKLDDRRKLRLAYGEGVSGCLLGIPLVLATLGVGKVNTAAGLALAIAQLKPAAVVQVGIGGAFPGSGLSVGDVAVASEEVHLDSGVLTAGGFEDMESLGFPLLTSPARLFNRIPVDSGLSESIAGARLPLVPFGTSETVSGRVGVRSPFRVAVESMEGAAAAQVALAAGVRFAEVRGISNLAGEREKSGWRIEEALEAANLAVEEWFRRE